MKITQVTPGILPIPPNGWGAVEKIIWEYHCNTNSLGHESKISYLDSVDANSDIVHIHVANLALMAKERGIKYIFTIHDHHAFVYGKESELYKEHIKAIEGSLITFVPAKFLVPYFNHPKVQYLEHGVNTDYFKPSKQIEGHRLLCVANNGFIFDQGYDRKGFSYAIQAAKILNLPITIAGPSNNKSFFEEYKQQYNKLTVLYDLKEDELLTVYKSHSIFIHPSILEAGHPNLTLLEAMACGLPIVGTHEYNPKMKGLYRTERNVTQLVKGITEVISNYSTYRSNALNTATEHSFNNITTKLIEKYKDLLKSKTMKDKLLSIYNDTQIQIRDNQPIPTQFNFSFIQGAKCEILGDEPGDFLIEFIDTERNKTLHTDLIHSNNWTKCFIEYHVDWLIRVTKNNVVVAEHKYNPENKRVYIAIDSSALGDTLAWFPMIDEYRKKWNCEVIVSTFNNYLFEGQYPELTLVNPGENVDNLYAMFVIGWHYNGGKINYNRNRSNFRLLPLQQTATDILNLPAAEIRPKLAINQLNTNIPSPYVVIAPHGSAHSKYWNHPGGWQKVIDFLKSIGYNVVIITKEKLGDPWHDSKLGGTLINVIDKTGDLPLDDRIADILNCDLFIGIGSGLSWVSWALGVKTMLISGFSEPYSEFGDCIRIHTENESICSGCYNKFKLDAGEWDWCPMHIDNPERIFECSKSIEPERVIKEISKILS